MKKLVFCLIATVIFGNFSYSQDADIVNSNCNLRIGEVVGKVDKNSFLITIDKEKLLNDFSIIAKESGLNVKYSLVEIRRANPEVTSTLYGLYGFSNDGYTNTAISLELNNGVFSISKTGATITCSSVDCTGSQCTAINTGTIWTCTACSKKGCSKTTVVVIKSFEMESN